MGNHILRVWPPEMARMGRGHIVLLLSGKYLVHYVPYQMHTLHSKTDKTVCGLTFVLRVYLVSNSVIQRLMYTIPVTGIRRPAQRQQCPLRQGVHRWMKKDWCLAIDWRQYFVFLSVLRCCWLDDRKNIHPVKACATYVQRFPFSWTLRGRKHRGSS